MPGFTDLDKGYTESLKPKRMGFAGLVQPTPPKKRGFGSLSQPVSTAPVESIPEPRNLIQNLKESASRGWEGTKIDLDYYKVLMGRENYKTVRETEKSFLTKISNDPIKEANLATKTIDAVAGMLPAMGAGISEGKATGMAFGATALAAGQLGPQIGMPEELITVPTAYAAGNLFGALQFWYRQGAGQLYGTLRKDGISDATARPIAHIGGALYGAIEFSQIDKLIPGSKLAAKNMIIKPLSKIVLKMTAKYGANWVHEVGEEGLQDIVLSVSEDIATNIEKKTNRNVGEMAKRAMRRGWIASKQAALPMLLLMSPGAAIETRRSLKQSGVNEEAIPGKSPEQQAEETLTPPVEVKEDIPEVETVTLEHYTPKPVEVINPEMQYTGQAGEEITTKKLIPYAENESYFYHEGQKPEARFEGLPKLSVKFTGKLLKNGTPAIIELLNRGKEYALAQGEAELDRTAQIEGMKKLAKQEGYVGIDWGKDAGLTTFAKIPVKNQIGNTLAINSDISQILDLSEANDGATYNVAFKQDYMGKPLYSVSIFPNATKIIKGTELDIKDVKDFVKDNEVLLGDTRNSVGTWLDKSKNEWVLDIVRTIPNKNKAMELGKIYNQDAIFDLENGKAIDVVKPQKELRPTEALLDIPSEETFKELKFGRITKKLLSNSIINNIVKEVESTPNLATALVDATQKDKIRAMLKLKIYTAIAPKIAKIAPSFVNNYKTDPLSQVIGNALTQKYLSDYTESKGLDVQRQIFKSKLVQTVESEIAKYAFMNELTSTERETYETLIRDYPTIKEKAKPGLLARSIAVGDNFFRKIGLPHIYTLGVKMFKNYSVDLQKVNEKIGGLAEQWQHEVKQLGLDVTGRAEVLWDIADGKDMLLIYPLSPLEKHIINEFKQDMEQLAIKDKLPQERMIGDYIFHEIEQSKIQQIDIWDAVRQNLEPAPKEIRNPALFVREGTKYRLKKDFWSAWTLRHKLSLRHEYFDPMANTIELASEKLSRESSTLLAEWFRFSILKQVPNIDKALNESVKVGQNVLKSLPILNKILEGRELPKDQEGRVFLNAARTSILLGTMGYNFPLTIRNLLQPALTLTLVSEKSLAKAYTILKNPAAQKILTYSVTARNRYPIVGVGEVFMQKLLKKSLVTYKAADQVNVYVSYLGNMIDGIDEIMKKDNVPFDVALKDIANNPGKYKQLLEISDEVATASQVGYTSPEMPPILWSVTGKTALQYTAWTWNYLTRYQVENFYRVMKGTTASGVPITGRQRLRVLQGLLYQGILAYLLGKLGVTAARTFLFGPLLGIGPAPTINVMLSWLKFLQGFGSIIIDPTPQNFARFKYTGKALIRSHEAFIWFSAITRKIMDSIFDPSVRNTLRLVLPLRKSRKNKNKKKKRGFGGLQ